MKKLPLFLALDLDSEKACLEKVKEAYDFVYGFKIGPRLFLKSPEIIKNIKKISPDAKVFLDFKFYDIPSSTVQACESASQIGADYVTIHSLLQTEALKELSHLEKKINEERFFKILAVSVLSSEEESSENKKKLLDRALRVYNSGLRGLVCSALDLKDLKKEFPDMTFVTPGIRFQGDKTQDQKRVLDPKGALNEGASLLVMGRSLIHSKNLKTDLKKLQTFLN